MTTMNSNEREERLKQIRERWSRMNMPQTVFTSHCKGDVDFLLSLLDSQATLTGFGKPEDEARRILTYAKDWIGDANYRVLHAEIVKSVAGLYSELDRVTKQRDELLLIVDAVTDDDPGTSLSKLHKIQHVAATQMRDQCVAKLRQIAAAYDNQHHQNTGAMISKQAIQYAARQLESLTLNVEQKEAK